MVNNPQHDDDPDIQHFLKWKNSEESSCAGTTGRQNDLVLRYMPIETLEEYFDSDRLNRLLKAVFFEGDAPNARDITGYIRSFAILLCCGQGRLINGFTDHENLIDKRPPFYEKPGPFPSSSTIELWTEFNKHQWFFCPLHLEYQKNRKLVENEILPLQFVEKLGEGGTSSVRKVKVHTSCNRLSPSDSGHKKAELFVVKTYKGADAKDYFDSETNALRELFRGNDPATNVIRLYYSFVRDDVYNLILEYADKGTLEEWMKTTEPPNTGTEIRIFWQRFFELLRGLSAIHNSDWDVSSPRGPRVMLGWHQDIKPSNILVKSRGSESNYDCDYIVADLGLTHFKKIVHKDQDAYSTNADGTYTYGAPETLKLDDVPSLKVRVGQQVDLWSFGCVCSEVATWIWGGWNRVEEYSERRRSEAVKAVGLGTGAIFHDTRRLLKVVEDHHSLISSSRRLDDLVTGNFLRGPVADMLNEKPEDRRTAQQLYGGCVQLLRDASDIAKAHLNQDEEEYGSPTTVAAINPAIPLGGSTRPHFSSPTVHNMPPQASTVGSAPPIMMSPGPSTTTHRRNVPHLSYSDAVAALRNKQRMNYKDKLSELANTDHVFLIDNTESMASHRNNLEGVVEVLSHIVAEFDPDGLDMFFTKSGSPIRKCKSPKTLMRRLKSSHFEGMSNMARGLSEVLRDYEFRLDNKVGLRQKMSDRIGTSGRWRPRNIYVLTDGLWQPGVDVRSVIEAMIEKLKQHGLAVKHQIGIQFIRFGNDLDAEQLLNYLDDHLDLDLDVVDWTQWNGNVFKMLLGATTPMYDDEEQDLPPDS
ncbi:hypothetical protein ACLMJK_004024 [Lecanora helva]